jgi:hypothetical protein
VLPTLNGRIQTRIFLLVVVGGIWTLLITPVLPMARSLGDAYATSYLVLLTVLVLGVGWELVYHLIQQFRWEKDWPTLFGLVTLVNEGLLDHRVARRERPDARAVRALALPRREAGLGVRLPPRRGDRR